MYYGSCQHALFAYKFTSKQRDAESGLDYFGARYDASSMGRFMSADPKDVSVHLSDPQSFNRYPYARNNPLLYVDPDGKDFEKALQDLKAFGRSLYVKASVGLGYEVRGRVKDVEATAGISYKVNQDISTDTSKLSHPGQIGFSAGVVHGQKVGESFSAEQTVITTNGKETTGAEKPEITRTDTLGIFGGDKSINVSSDNKVGFGIELPAADLPFVGGIEFGTNREGISNLKGALSEVKDSLTNPGPPPPPKPPTPPCTTATGAPCDGNTRNK